MGHWNPRTNLLRLGLVFVTMVLMTIITMLLLLTWVKKKMMMMMMRMRLRMITVIVMMVLLLLILVMVAVVIIMVVTLMMTSCLSLASSFQPQKGDHKFQGGIFRPLAPNKLSIQKINKRTTQSNRLYSYLLNQKSQKCLLDYCKKQTNKQKSPLKSIHKLDPINFLVDYSNNKKSQEHTQTRPSKLGCGLWQKQSTQEHTQTRPI